MADTFQSALAQQGTTPAQQQGKAQRSTADKARSGLQGLSSFNTATGLMGNALIGGVPGIALGLANAVVNPQSITGPFNAGIAALNNIANRISNAFNDGTGAYQGSSTFEGGPSIGGTGGFDMTVTGPAPTSGVAPNFAENMANVSNLVSQAVQDSTRGGGGGGGSSGGGDYGGGQEARGVAMGGLVAPRGTGGLQDLMRGYI